MRVDTAFERGRRRRAPTPPGTAAGSPPRSSRLRRAAPRWAGRTRSRPGRTASWSAASTGRDRRPLRRRVDVPPRHATPRRSRWSRLADARLRRRRPPAAGRRAVGHAAPGEPGRPRGAARGLLPPPRRGAAAPLPEPWRDQPVPAGAGPERLRLADDHDEPLVRRPVAVDLVRRRPQLVAAHPAPGGHVVAGGRVVASTVTTVPAAASRAAAASRITGSGQRRPRASTTSSSPVTGPAAPSSAPRTAATASGSTAQEPLDVGRRGRGATAASGRVTRTLPWVSTPIAARTWLGSSVLEVQAEPDATAKPRRSSSPTSASPSTYRHEKVTTCGSRSTGSPTTSVSGTPRGRGADPVDERGGAGAARSPRVAAVCCQASAAARARATTGSASVRPPSSSLAGPGPAPPGALGHDEHADAGGAAPRAGVADQHVVRRGQRVASQRGHRVHQQRYAVGRGAAATPRPAAGGCRPRRWRACTAAATVPGAARARSSASRSTRPSRSTGTSSSSGGSPAVAARWRPSTRTAECSTAEATSRRAPAAPGVQQPLAPRSQRDRARGQERQLGRPHAQPGRDHLAGPVEQRAGLPPLGVEAARVGPARRRARPAACRGRRAAAEPPTASSSARATGASGVGDTRVDGSPTLEPDAVTAAGVGFAPLEVRPNWKVRTLRRHDDTPAPVKRRGLTLTGLAVACALALSGCGEQLRARLPAARRDRERRHVVTSLWIWSWIAALAVGVLVWGLIIWCVVAYRAQEGRRRPARAAALQRADRDPLHGRPAVHGRRCSSTTPRATSPALLDVSQKPDVDGQRRRQAVELGLQLRRGQRPTSRARRPSSTGKPGVAEDPSDPVPAGQQAGRVRADRARRHPLVLGAGVPAEARHDPGQGQQVPGRPDRDRAPSRASAPSCAAPTTRRCCSRSRSCRRQAYDAAHGRSCGPPATSARSTTASTGAAQKRQQQYLPATQQQQGAASDGDPHHRAASSLLREATQPRKLSPGQTVVKWVDHDRPQGHRQPVLHHLVRLLHDRRRCWPC